MTKQTRNWLIVIFIVAFPLVLFLSFLIFMEAEPNKSKPNEPGKADLPDPSAGTNVVHAP
jgi:hypothetical protein